MPEPEQSPQITPYSEDGIGLNWKAFIDRLSLKREFAMKVGFKLLQESNGQSDRLEVDPAAKQLSDWAWVVEGRRGFGKSAFAAWCRGIRKQVGPNDTVIVAYASPDLCANANVGPIEAALHRLRGQVLRQIGRTQDGRDFGWYSAGEVLRAIAEEAYQKAQLPDQLRCIVFILHNVSILPATSEEPHWADRKCLSEVERQVASLIAELSRLDSEELDAEGPVRRPRPAVGLLALAYPGFYDRVGPALRSRFVMHQELKAFKRNDVQIFAYRYLGSSDNLVVDALFHLTGGIPDLLQAIAKQVRQEQSETQGDTHQSANRITAARILLAVQHPNDELKSHLIEHFRDRGLSEERIFKDNIGILGILSEIFGSIDVKSLEQLEAEGDSSNQAAAEAVSPSVGDLTGKEFLEGKFLTSDQCRKLSSDKNFKDPQLTQVLGALAKAGVLSKSSERHPSYTIGIGALLINLKTCLGES